MRRSFTLLSTLVCFAFFVAAFLLPTNANAQKKQSAKSAAFNKAKPGKASDAKKDSKSAKNDKKADKKADKNSKNNDRNSAKNRNDKKNERSKSAKEDERRTADKRGKKDQRDERNAKNSKDDKKNARDDKRRMTAAEKRAELERRRREEAERRAREEAARRAREEAERRRREAIARQRAFENGLKTETQANIAADDTRGEDLTVRQAAINALGNRAGSVVVMDAQNGQIITAVNQKWAFGHGSKPCSTIKLVTGAAGVNESVINQFGNVSTKPTRLDLTDALAVSNNGYFQVVGGEVGFDKVMSYARELGLGQTTGINAPGESPGKIPSAKSANRMYSHGDEFEVTPLQLATMVSAIGNGGKLLQPQIARTPKEAEDLRVKVRRDVNISKSTLQTLIPGMMGAVNYGTARRAGDPTLNIGGKTGSCIGQGSWVGLFASVAPVASPKYAVVVVTRGQSERGKWAAAVAGQVYQALAPKIRALQPLLANSPAPPAPQPKVDVNAAGLSDEEDDDSAEAAELKTVLQQNVPANNNQNQKTLDAEKNRLVKPTVAVKPVNQPNNSGATPNTKKGEYTPRQSTPAPQTTPTVQIRPRIVPQ